MLAPVGENRMHLHRAAPILGSALVALLLTLPQAGSAQTAAPPPGAGRSAVAAAGKRPTPAQSVAIRRACGDDLAKLCAGIPPGGAAGWTCLQANAASATPACRQAVEAVTDAGGAPPSAAPANPASRPMSRQEALIRLRAACALDLRARCPAVPATDDRMASCLEQNAEGLSPRCKDALAAARQAH
jgi:hypothetical protein